MAIYPKRNKKKVRSFYPGGRMPQGAADSPLVGIGLQYRATNAEAPNLQAAQYLDASLRESDAKHEEEYKKRLFDRKAYNDQMSKIIGTAGAKGRLSQDFNSALDAYEDKARENIDFVWTDEGRKMAKNIENVLDPGKIEKMKANYADITTQYEQSLKNGTLNQNHVVNGMTSVIDKEGNLKKVHPTMLNSEENQGFRPLTNKEYYESAINHPEYDFAGTDIAYSGATIKNTDEILKDWSSKFAGLGYTGTDGIMEKIKSNHSQVNAVKQSIKSGMSGQENDAMLGLYLSKNKVFDPKGYEKWLDGVIDDLSEGKKIYDSDLKPMPDLSKLGGGRTPKVSAEEDRVLPALQVYTGQIFGDRDDWMAFADGKIGLMFTGESDYKTSVPIQTTLRGEVYLLGDKAGWESTDEQLAPRKDEKWKGKDVFGDVRYPTMSETTGFVLKVKNGLHPDGGKLRPQVSEKWKAKSLISPHENMMGASVAGTPKTDSYVNDKGENIPYRYVSLGQDDKGIETRLMVSNTDYLRKVIVERDPSDNSLTGDVYISDVTPRESFSVSRGDNGRIPDASKLAYNNGSITALGQKQFNNTLNDKYTQAMALYQTISALRGRPEAASVKAEYDRLSAEYQVLLNYTQGTKSTPETVGLPQPEIDRIISENTGTGLQRKIWDEYYNTEIKPSLILPKTGYTTNLGGNIGGLN